MYICVWVRVCEKCVCVGVCVRSVGVCVRSVCVCVCLGMFMMMCFVDVCVVLYGCEGVYVSITTILHIVISPKCEHLVYGGAKP